MRNTKKPGKTATRHIPTRTCIACRQPKDKRELVRIVRAEGGEIEIDPSGKKPGRGAYMCKTRECWENGLKSRSLEHALRGKVRVTDRERLIQEAERLTKGDRTVTW